MKSWTDLLLLNGQIVRIECRQSDEDEVRESIEHAIVTGGWWPTGRWTGCSATYLGTQIERVNAGQVAAML